MFHYQISGCPHLEGRLMMLPRKEEVAERIPSTQAIETGIFNHPVVVLSRQLRNGNVAVFVVTSFDNTPIEKRHRDRARRQPYFPIRPACHPDNSSALVIAHGKTMKKQSYVNTKNVHEIPFAILRTCWQDDDFHLESESYRTLTSVLWKQNLAELTIRLRGHGIFEPVREPAHVEIPRSTLNRSTDQRRLHDLRYSAGHIGTSSRVDSYGTFIHGSTEANLPRAMKAATTSNTRTFDSSYRTYDYHVPGSWVSDDATFQQNDYRRNYLPIQQRTYSASDDNKPGRLLFFFVIVCLVLGFWYYAHT